MEDTSKCARCDQPHITHPYSGEKTCFVHGNPNGSEFERAIWERGAE